jgi:hypothetical protein
MSFEDMICLRSGDVCGSSIEGASLSLLLAVPSKSFLASRPHLSQELQLLAQGKFNKYQESEIEKNQLKKICQDVY